MAPSIMCQKDGNYMTNDIFLLLSKSNIFKYYMCFTQKLLKHTFVDKTLDHKGIHNLK